MKTLRFKPTNNLKYSYAYYELWDKFTKSTVNALTAYECWAKYEGKVYKELITHKDVDKCLKEDLLPFFESIFNINLLETYLSSNEICVSSIFDALRTEYIDFIYHEANSIAEDLNDFKNGNLEFYQSFSSLENGYSRSICRFVFKNSQFTGKESNYVLHGGSNLFIKEFLKSILIQIREKPKTVTSRLLQLEFNRIQVLILKNTSFNFLSWYLAELKSALNDLKFVHDQELTYGLKCSEIIIKQLYRKLKRENFIDIDHTTETNFTEVFLKEWYTHDSICVLKMDNPQTKYFLDQFKVHIDASLKVSDIAKVKNIANNNGFISSSSLSASSSRNKLIGPKREEDLLLLFK